MFGWFKKRKQTAPVRALHGFDLDQWHFLGRTTIQYSNSSNVVYSEADVFFFLNKTTAERRYVIPAGKSWDHHNMVLGSIQLWSIGELGLITVIHKPSQWLKQHVWDTRQYVWSEEQGWWVRGNAAQYQAAVEAQKNQPRVATDENVIAVEFRKKD